MAHFLPPEHVGQVNKLEWPKGNFGTEAKISPNAGASFVLKSRIQRFLKTI